VEGKTSPRVREVENNHGGGGKTEMRKFRIFFRFVFFLKIFGGGGKNSPMNCKGKKKKGKQRSETLSTKGKDHEKEKRESAPQGYSS